MLVFLRTQYYTGAVCGGVAVAEEWRRARAEGMAVRPVASSFTDLLRLIISRRAYGLRTEYKSLSSWLLSCWAALEVPNMNVFD